ncbi:MAG: hypothetical protein QGG14_07695 [Planctomycetota bacterium]|nr:hypothetical protein [Planctomycetota bacterium]
MTTSNDSKYVGKWNKHGQCKIVKAASAHLPHIEVNWYLAGMGQCMIVAVPEGKTAREAAIAAMEGVAYKTRSYRGIELFDEHPSNREAING